MKRLTVVIPTLNEASYLPAAFDCLSKQTYSAFDVVVADNSSTDNSVDLSLAKGATVVRGGIPSVARNAGARHSNTPYILFLDADVKIDSRFVENAVNRLERSGADAASFAFRPVTTNTFLHFIHGLSLIYFWLCSSLGFPHGIGGAILVRRASHIAAGGFDESVLVAEDLDYFRRIAKVGRFCFILSPSVQISVRRFIRDGIALMCVKWLLIEAHRIVLGEVRHNRFRYFKYLEVSSE